MTIIIFFNGRRLGIFIDFFLSRPSCCLRGLSFSRFYFFGIETFSAWCPTDVDECQSSPCLNGATCVDLVNGFQCRCADGWQGERCDQGKHFLEKLLN
jgi:EGF-like domain